MAGLGKDDSQAVAAGRRQMTVAFQSVNGESGWGRENYESRKSRESLREDSRDSYGCPYLVKRIVRTGDLIAWIFACIQLLKDRCNVMMDTLVFPAQASELALERLSVL